MTATKQKPKGRSLLSAAVEGHPEWVKDFYNNIKTERERYTLSDHELDAVIRDLILTLDQHFIEAAFNFRENLWETGGHWPKRPYVEGFIDKLKPHSRVVEKRLRRAFPYPYYKDAPTHDPEQDISMLIMDIEESAYVIGVFMGAKLAGASTERLNLLSKHLVF